MAVLRIATRDFAALVNRHFPTSTSSSAECVVEGNAIEPRKELAISLKTAKFQKRLDKRILNNIFRFVMRASDVQHGVEQAILKSFDEYPERSALACQSFANKVRFCFHSGGLTLD